jgi:hypothetical protein
VKTKIIILALVCAAVVAPGASAATGLAGYARDAGLTTTPTCAPHHRLRTLGGAGDTVGLFEPWTRRVFIDTRLCAALERYAGSHASDGIDTLEVAALVTLFHEAAHAHGVRAERVAECEGVRGALAVIRRDWPHYYADAKHYALVEADKYRPAAYKLGATCPIDN